MSNPTICEGTHNVISSPELASGPLPCAALGGLTIDQFSRALAPANLSASQAKAAGLLTSGIYGLISTTSSRSDALQQSLASRLQVMTALSGSTLYALTWKARGTAQQRPICALRASVRRISDNACSGWVTPTTRDHKDSGCDIKPRSDGTERFDQLPRQANLCGWKTPRANDWKGGLSPDGNNKRNPADYFLTDQVTMLAGWPTPTCQSPNSLRGKGQDPMKRKEQGHAVNLTDAVNYVDLNRPARLTATGELLTGSLAGMESGGQLNPAHSRWLMGLPPEWDDCAPTAMPSRRK